MKPTIGQILLGSATTLTEDIAPNIQGAPFAIGRLGTIGLILACLAQEADRAVETAVREQDAMRALFADAAKLQVPEDLRQRLRRAGADDSRPSLKLSELEIVTTQLSELLQDLLEHCEAAEFDWSIQLETRIWRLLKAGADRRALFLPVL